MTNNERDAKQANQEEIKQVNQPDDIKQNNSGGAKLKSVGFSMLPRGARTVRVSHPTRKGRDAAPDEVTPIKKKRPPALKHAAYSATTILPGEDRRRFEKLHREYIDEVEPTGPFERLLARRMAHLTFRLENMSTFRQQELAKRHVEELKKSNLKWSDIGVIAEELDPDKIQRDEAFEQAERAAREELGEETYELVEMGEAATLACLMRDLEVEGRVIAEIAKCYKLLALVHDVREARSLQSSPPTQPHLGKSGSLVTVRGRPGRPDEEDDF